MKAKMLYTLLIMGMISFGTVGCIGPTSGLEPQGGIAESIPVSKTYSASHEKIWQASRAILDEWGYIYEANQSSNTIKTEPKQLNPPKGVVGVVFSTTYLANLYITVEGSTVSFRARFGTQGYGVAGRKDLEYPEKENELRKNFFEALNAKVGT